MSSFFNLIFTVLTVPPGNLIYHFVLAFSIAGALQAAIHYRRTNDFPQARRTVIGLAILLGLQLLLFIVSGLSWRGILASSVVLPPLDRTVSFLSLIWIAWLWAFPEPVRLADAASMLVTLLGVAILGLTGILYLRAGATGFNLTTAEFIWQAVSLAMALLGLLALILRRPNGWGTGLAMLILALLGHLASLLVHVYGDFPGAVRLAHLAMFPLLLTLPQRFPASVKQEPRKKVSPDKKNDAPIWQERRRYSTDPKTFQSLINLAAASTSDKICQNLTRSIAQAMLADLCFLVTLGEDKNLTITCGYDLIREESLGGTSVVHNSIPLLANAVHRARPLRMPASSTSTDMKGLGQTLGLSSVGHLLCVPIASHERGPVGAILILSPYSNRLWTADDQIYLTNVSALLLPVLERGEQVTVLEREREMAHQETRTAQEELQEIRRQAEAMEQRSQAPSAAEAQLKVQAENLAALMVMQEQAEKQIEQLRTENEGYRIKMVTQEDVQKQLEQIEQLRSDNEKLRLDLVSAQARSDQLEDDLQKTPVGMPAVTGSGEDGTRAAQEEDTRPTVPITNEQVEVIASISQDLRQPMSSIIGYTDLLLGESVGILGALQRKFVERVKASTERIGGLVDDLIQITNLDTGRFEFKPELIDLNLIIDNAMAYTSTLIREKNITLRLDIPENPPQMMMDRDALQQVLIHLLQNATAATPLEGVITLRVQLKVEEDKSYLALQVTDTGGGIASTDIPRVFARRYRAEHSLIQGVGDTGVGLSIAKTLVEAQNGRIWVETEANTGSTFSVVLPILPVEVED